MTAKLGRADLHIHTLASDGTSGIAEILDHVERSTDLDVIAITDHERIDAAIAAQAISRDRGLRAQVVVGEEVTTRGGHLLGLYLTERVKPLQSLRSTIAAIHDQGGLAIPAHPLVPYPLCAQGWVLRRLIAEPDPRFHPDALEAFNLKISRVGGLTKARLMRDLAQELMELYGVRAALEGHAYPSDTPWQIELEGSFPFEETPDQVQAIAEVKPSDTRSMLRINGIGQSKLTKYADDVLALVSGETVDVAADEGTDDRADATLDGA